MVDFEANRLAQVLTTPRDFLCGVDIVYLSLHIPPAMITFRWYYQRVSLREWTKSLSWGFVWLPSENLTIFDIPPYSLLSLDWAVVWDVCPLMMPVYLLMSEQLIFCVDRIYKTAVLCCHLTDELFTGRTQNQWEQKTSIELSCVNWLHLTLYQAVPSFHLSPGLRGGWLKLRAACYESC